MSGLILKLAPKERILLNGAVLENGDRRARLRIITPRAHILRLREALHPDQADTPLRRLCYTVQLVLTGDISDRETRPVILHQLDELILIFKDHKARHNLERAVLAIHHGQFYKSYKLLRSLMADEKALLKCHA
ncbi:MAG: flagellar biosynthesis repressor FlbT [Candidatus Puniceispirillum sp.]|jgi:flagellar protein FlbT